MNYQVHKHITPRETSAVGRIVKPVLFIVMIPVLVIAFLSSLLVSFLVYMKGLIIRKEITTEPFHEELVLIERPGLKVMMIEGESDGELATANEAWAEKVFGQHTYLYRVETFPVIEGLHNSICGYYLSEKNDGAILQQLISSISLETRMLFLDYSTFNLTVISNIGAFYLYNDEKTNEIKGFNETEKLLIDLIPG